MSSAFLFVALVAQSLAQNPFPPYSPRAAAATHIFDLASLPQTAEQSQQDSTALEQVRFAASFNHLKKTLNDFAEAYNRGILDLKKIEDVKKAWRDLEKAEARFRLDKGK